MMTNLTMTENTENETINEESVLAEDSIQEMTYLTPEMFFEEASNGAESGNDVEDYTDAIQRCFDAAAVYKKSVFFTSGKTYRILRTIDISAFGGTNIEKTVIGYGAKIEVAFEGFAFKAVCNTTANTFNCEVKGLTIAATPENDPVICTIGKSSGFNIKYYQFLDFEDCIFEKLKTGIYCKDVYYENIVKSQFIGCKMGMVFDVSDSYGKRETNNVTIDRCRLTTELKQNMYVYDGDTYVDNEGNTLLKAIKFIETEVEENKIVLIPETETAPLGMAGIYIKGYPHGFRITNNCIELYQYGICGCGDLSAVSQSELFISNNYFELNKYHIYLSGIEFEKVNRIINDVEINEEFVPRWLHSKRYMCANITDNYYCGSRTNDSAGVACGTDGKIVLGKGENRLKNNRWYNCDCIEVDNTAKNSIYENVIIYMDDDMFVNVLGDKLRTRIHSLNDVVTTHPTKFNSLCRNLRDTRYFINGVGKKQVIENTDMMYPLYDGSFNPDESHKYAEKTLIRVNGASVPCLNLKSSNTINRYHTAISKDYDNELNTKIPRYRPVYAPLTEIFKFPKDEEETRFFVDRTSGMLIDYATRSYCGTMYGTELTSNPAYGGKEPTEAVPSPVPNEIYCKLINVTEDENGHITGGTIDKYYLYDENGWVECNYVTKTY